MRHAATEASAPTAILLACAAAVVLTAVPAPRALAEEAIPTAARGPGDGAPPAAESGPLRLSDRIDEGPDRLRPMGPCGGPAGTQDGKADRTPHGAVWAGVGTSGYREIGGVVCAPLGDNAALSIAVDAGHIDGWRNRR